MRTPIWRTPSRPTRRLSAGALAAVLALAGVSTLLPAIAQPHGEGPGGAMMFGGPPGRMVEHVDRMLDGLGATPAQRAQIRQIVVAAAADLRQQRQASRPLHERGLQIFTAPTVDAGAAESLRQELAAQHDHESRRVLEAMLDIAKVLTPEQRAKIGARAREREAVMQDRRQRMEQDHRMPPAPQKP